MPGLIHFAQLHTHPVGDLIAAKGVALALAVIVKSGIEVDAGCLDISLIHALPLDRIDHTAHFGSVLAHGLNRTGRFHRYTCPDGHQVRLGADALIDRELYHRPAGLDLHLLSAGGGRISGGKQGRSDCCDGCDCETVHGHPP